MKAIHFGAGNIGRGFIGLILKENGFDVTFADVSAVLIDELKKKGEYDVILADPSGEKIHVSGVHALNSQTEGELLADAVAEADLITTAVGPNIVPLIAKNLVPGIRRRIEKGEETPFSVIACENAVGASTILKKALFESLTPDEQTWAEVHMGFPDSAVDRIVPLQNNAKPLDVKVEPFFEWVVESGKVKGNFPPLKGVHYVEELKPYIERKLFTVNTGHAATAYFGMLRGYQTVLEAISDPAIEAEVREVLKETAFYITTAYGFDPKEHQAYVDTIIRRFKNPEISDDLSRVGRSPLRKISRSDRFVTPALGVLERGKDPVALAKAMAAAMKTRHGEDPESVTLTDFIAAEGVEAALEKFSGLEKTHPLTALVVKAYAKL